ncbi:hypothetical protein CEXT_87931 [Caerostris extrusa]|uniref:Uncharacterized protein n=1 Tax=Caerostris extrusa TaxID=172846 RepID=A0AAV4XSC3_CAEEX|nr:hypothetical protein CEXT_87931 [Caerostris extrusa]
MKEGEKIKAIKMNFRDWRRLLEAEDTLVLPAEQTELKYFEENFVVLPLLLCGFDIDRSDSYDLGEGKFIVESINSSSVSSSCTKYFEVRSEKNEQDLSALISEEHETSLSLKLRLFPENDPGVNQGNPDLYPNYFSIRLRF